MTNICRPDLNLGFCFAEKPEKIFPKSRFGSRLLKVRKFCISRNWHILRVADYPGALCDVPFEAFFAVTLVQIRQSVSRNFLFRFRPTVVVGGHPLTLHLFPLSSIVKTI